MADLEKWKRVGERAGALIRLRGYKSVELFAHENDIDKSVLNRLIRGKREVRLSTFLKIAEALEVSIPELNPSTGLQVREKETALESRTARAKAPEAGGKVFKFLRTEFDRIEIRKSTRDKNPLVVETSRKSEGLAVHTNAFKIDV